MKTFLMPHGNVLVDDGNRAYIQNYKGKYIRPCIDSEYQNLRAVDDLREIQFIDPIDLGLKQDEPFPEWKHLTSVDIYADYSKYDSNYSANGGAYAFFTVRHFLYLNHNCYFRFGYIDETTSSADFQITWDGQFQNSIVTIEFLDGPKTLQPVYVRSNFDTIDTIILDSTAKYLHECSLSSIFATTFYSEGETKDADYSRPCFTKELEKNIRKQLKIEGYKTRR